MALRFHPTLRSHSPPQVRGGWDEAVASSLSLLHEHGGVVWDGCVPAEALTAARADLLAVMAACREGFDAGSDTLKIRFREFGITRAPKVHLAAPG